MEYTKVIFLSGNAVAIEAKKFLSLREAIDKEDKLFTCIDMDGAQTVIRLENVNHFQLITPEVRLNYMKHAQYLDEEEERNKEDLGVIPPDWV